MKRIALFLFLICSLAHAQWKYQSNDNKKAIEAVGEIKFNRVLNDTLTFNLSKSRKLGLDFSILGNYFKPEGEYYVLFEISAQKIKVIQSIVEQNRYRIVEVKDLVSNEKFELEDFLKILKRGEDCVLTIRTNSQVIQGYNQLIGSGSVINSVLNGQIP